MPRSSARWMTFRDVSRSVRWPKLLQPSPTAETRRPEPPRLRICMEQPCRKWEAAIVARAKARGKPRFSHANHVIARGGRCDQPERAPLKKGAAPVRRGD